MDSEGLYPTLNTPADASTPALPLSRAIQFLSYSVQP